VDGIRERAGAGTHKKIGSIGLHRDCGAWTKLEYNLAVGVWRAFADRGLGCENSCMAETGIWNGCCVIRIGLPLTDQTGQDFGSRRQEQGLMVELSPLWLRFVGVSWLGASVGWEGETRGAFIYAGVPG